MASSIVAPLTRKAVQSLATTVSKRISNNFTKTPTACVRPIHSTVSSVKALLQDLRDLDTSSLCDANKTIMESSNDESNSIKIKLMNGTIRPMNHLNHRHPDEVGSGAVMAGVARTVSFTEPDDFLPVMRALALEAEMDEVLVVDTMSSMRAVAGEIFVNEARRKALAGIVIDGPVRDTAYLDNTDEIDENASVVNNGNDEAMATTPTMRIYATGITPYSGTTQSPGIMQPAVVTCGGIEVRPGEIVVGDNDGIIVGELDAFLKLVPVARNIQLVEQKLIAGITASVGGRPMDSMTNLEEHVRHRLEGKSSKLEFRI